MDANLRKNFDWYLEHQDELVRQYNGQVLAIRDCRVIGSYDSYVNAYYETLKNNDLGTFIIQKCSPGPSDYTVEYYTPLVTFRSLDSGKIATTA